MNEEKIDQLILELDRVLPLVFARSKIDQYLGGLISPKYLAVLDSDGQGPDGSFRCGRHVGYQKSLFWPGFESA